MQLLLSKPVYCSCLKAWATPFELRPIGVELQLCQRYYYASGNNNIYFTGNSGNNALARGYAQYPVVMRAVPAVTIVSGTAYISNINSQTASTVFADGITTTHFGSLYLASGFPSTGYTYGIIYTANAEL